MRQCVCSIVFLLLIPCLAANVTAAEPLQLQKRDHIAYIGNTLADRMQHHAWLETYIHAIHPNHDLTFRNLGFPGDMLTSRQRSANFGNADQWLAKVQADVIFCFFGYNEALNGPGGINGFQNDLAKTIDGMRAQKYNGKSAPRIVMFSPIAHENLRSRHLPDGTANNKNLAAYSSAMADVCRAKDVLFVDLFQPTQKLYAAAQKPLTMNGIHLLDHGNQAVAEVIVDKLFGKPAPGNISKLREVVLDKNLHWFSRYRVVDGYNVYGGRSKLNWFGQSNADVMKREMEIFDVMTANRDQRVWAVAGGGDLEVKDDNLPSELSVRTNKQGPLEAGRFPYLGGKEAINKMTIASGLECNLFASEEMFPELINPVQMAVDTDGRLFASVWPSYPHWNPTQPRTDRIVCLPDEDGDGVADECIVFADKLNSITGFEFWGGGMLVAAPPEIWFLKDSDGDDKADVKIRMLQGVSSADSHHSANAVVIGPDGGMYWSRGIFNVASMETPTKLFRSGASGVHRFDPRTFEMSFHFPIGPNPHGDVFDRWGYQFANDGTGGTGSYVNIGKGIGNKQWFKKRVRPVPATGILSSPHFPESMQNNFLICNAIGFLGVAQHEVKYNGADITCEEIEPLVYSDDPNFRPTDLEIGGDGALYISDWANALIGHMQHNIRDPNRDHEHGRIYRFTASERDLLKPAKMKGKPVAQVCENFFSQANSVRYRARLELSGRETDELLPQVAAWTNRLDPKRVRPDRDEAQALLESLWVFEEHRVPNFDLLKKVLLAAEPRVRAAAIRTLGHWAGKVDNWEDTLLTAAQDKSALVRAEAVKAAVEFQGLAAAEVIFETATRPLDAELNTVLSYAKRQIDVDRLAQDAVAKGSPLSPAARKYILQTADANSLLRFEKSPAFQSNEQRVTLYEAILNRPTSNVETVQTAIARLSSLQKMDPTKLLLDVIEKRDATNDAGSVSGPARVLAGLNARQLAPTLDRIEKLALNAQTATVRQASYAALISGGHASEAFVNGSQTKQRLSDLLKAIPQVATTARGELYNQVRPFISDLPASFGKEGTASLGRAGIQVDYYYPSGSNVARETLEQMKPRATGIVPAIVMNVPQRKQADKFALRFTGSLLVPASGRYTFYLTSDDGSRLYIGDNNVINHDGLHGMSTKAGSIDLPAGAHPIEVTYFDNGGGDGLRFEWAGPDFKRTTIPSSQLMVGGGATLHDLAIDALASIPGHDTEKVRDLSALVRAGKHRAAAIGVLKTLPASAWSDRDVPSMIDNLIGYLSEFPASFRTGPPAMDAVALTNSLAGRLSSAAAMDVKKRLNNLDVRIIAIGTVPERMIYDKEEIVVQAGKPIEFRFSNADKMPHNFAITMMGALEGVGELAEKTGRDKDAQQRHYIPVSDKILVSSRLLEPGQEQSLSFVAPKEPGVYPYVCTYPGHWRRMFGALFVVDDLQAWQADPQGYLASAKLPLKDELLKTTGRNTEWTFADLIPDVSKLPHGRSFAVGKKLFTAANCTGCHRMNNEGREFGPDLTKIDPKKHTTEHILRSLVEPSYEIHEKYQSWTFVTDSGKVVNGMIVKEDANIIETLADPLANAKPIRIKKGEIDERKKSKTSIMPKGLLNKLSREEILDLIAYVFAKGNSKHMLFGEHHQH